MAYSHFVMAATILRRVGDPRAVLTRPARPADLTLRYGPHRDHVVDVRLPADPTPAPLVVVVHGGFWAPEWGRAHAGPQSEGLAAAGYVVATVDYRRGAGDHGWSAIFDDAGRLADTAPGLVADAAPGRVDRGATVLVGHSAGGHLAAWAVSRHRLPADAPWHTAGPPARTAVVSLAGVLDLAEAARLRLGDGAVDRLLGGAPAEVPDRLRVADPAALLPAGVPVACVHGTADDRVPVTQSRAYVGTALARGDPAVLHELDGVGHFELIDPLAPAWPAVLAAVAEAVELLGR